MHLTHVTAFKPTARGGSMEARHTFDVTDANGKLTTWHCVWTDKEENDRIRETATTIRQPRLESSHGESGSIFYLSSQCSPHVCRGNFLLFFFFICWILEILPSAAVCTGARPELSSRSIVVTADWNKAGTKIFLLLIVPRECYDIAGFNVQRLKKMMLSWTASFIVMARKKLNSHL